MARPIEEAHAAFSPSALAVDEVVTRVALLAGLGARARALGALAGELTSRAGGRTCVDAGGPIQVMIDAPGPRALRLGMATGRVLPTTALDGWCTPDDLEALDRAAAPWRGHESWTVWTPEGLDWYADLRGAGDVLERAGGGGMPDAAASQAIPWAAYIRVRGGRAAVSLQWLLRRDAPVTSVLDTLAPNGGTVAQALFSPLMGRTLSLARWVVTQPVDSPPSFRVGCARWSLVPEDNKHATIAEALQTHDGPVAYGGAVWSLLRGLSGPGWRVGRGLEGWVEDGRPHLRIILVPEAARLG